MTTHVAPPSSSASRDPLRPAGTTNSRIVMPRMIRRAAMALALAGVAAFGAIVYSAYQGRPSSPGEVPLLMADNSPLRVRPSEEGGMTVANRDTTIYDSLDGHISRPGIERLMPATEQPVDGPAAPEPRRPDGTPALTADEIRLMHQQTASVQSGDAAEQAMQQLSVAANRLPQGAAQGMTSTVQGERIEPPAAPTRTASAPEPVATPVAEASQPQPAEQVAAVPAAPAPAPREVAREVASAPTPAEERAAAAVRPAAGAASRMVQLGAVRSEDAARTEWARLQRKYSAQLGSLDLTVQRVDLGARGIYWRIQGGPVSADQGRKICDALKAGSQSCITVSR